MNCTAWQPPWSPSGTSTCMGANRKLLQLAKGEPFRLRDARELRPLNGRGGQRSRGKRLFQSVAAKDAPCPPPPVKGLSQLRKRAGQSGGRRKRRARFAPQEVSSKPVNEVAVGTIIADRPPHGSARALVSASGSYRG